MNDISKRKKQILLALLIFMLMACLPVLLKAEDKKTVKIAYTDHYNYINKDSSGDMYGYAVEYMDKIAEYTDWQYEYSYMPMTEALSKLKNGDVDFICSATDDFRSDEDYNFSYNPIINEKVMLYTLPDKDLYYEDFQNMNGKKIAVLKLRKSDYSALVAYLKVNKIQCDIIEYNSSLEMFTALKSCEVDMMTAPDISVYEGFRAIDVITSVPVYVLSYKDSVLLKDFDDSANKMNTRDAFFEKDLYEKYYGEGKDNDKLPLTREEADFIKSKKSVSVGCYSKNIPFFYVEEGNLAGINCDIINMISKKSGLNFNIIPFDNNEQMRDSIVTGKIDLLLDFESSLYSDAENIKLSKPLSEFNVMAVEKRSRISSHAGVGQKQKLLVNLPEIYRGSESKVYDFYPDCEIMYTDTSSSSLKSVFFSDSDVSFIDEYSLNLQNNRSYLNNLYINNDNSFKSSLHFISFETKGETIISIIDKTLNITDKNDINKIISLNMNKLVHNSSVFDLIYNHKMSTGIILLLLISIFLIIIFIIFYKDKTKKKKFNSHIASSETEKKIDTFSRISHEMRTPLCSVISLSDSVLRNSSDMEGAVRNVRNIKSASEYLLSLMDDIQDMAKIQSSKMRLVKSENSIFALIDEINSIIIPYAEEKNIKYIHRIENCTDVYLKFDSKRLKQLLINLLTNAIKFTPDGGEVDFLAIQKYKTERYVFIKFIIKDTGVGMSEEFLPKMFLPFEQEQDSVSGYSGSGLGLAICKNIVSLMDGAISVNSRKNEGTEINVVLKFGLFREKNTEAEKEYKTTECLYLGKRALLAEDYSLNAETIAELLSEFGIAYDLTENGFDAFEKFKMSENGYYDIVFMDLMMPVMTGFEAANAIRKLDRIDSKSVPIISITADFLDRNLEKAIGCGMTANILKPVGKDDIKKIISQYL